MASRKTEGPEISAETAEVPNEEVLTFVPQPQFPLLQFSMFLGDDQFVIRADSVDEFRQVLDELKENGEDVIKTVTGLKTAHVAHGISTKSGYGNGGGNSGGASRASDSGPQSSGVPNCDKHNEPMKDLGTKYRYRYYCPRPRNEQQGCNPKVKN